MRIFWKRKFVHNVENTMIQRCMNEQYLFYQILLFIPFLAIHNWHGKVNHGLALDVGDFVEIFEENGQWWRGACTRKPRSIGIFPKSFIHVKDPTKEDQVVAECTQILREWSEIWKKLYVVSAIVLLTTSFE